MQNFIPLNPKIHHIPIERKSSRNSRKDLKDSKENRDPNIKKELSNRNSKNCSLKRRQFGQSLSNYNNLTTCPENTFHGTQKGKSEIVNKISNGNLKLKKTNVINKINSIKKIQNKPKFFSRRTISGIPICNNANSLSNNSGIMKNSLNNNNNNININHINGDIKYNDKNNDFFNKKNFEKKLLKKHFIPDTKNLTTIHNDTSLVKDNKGESKDNKDNSFKALCAIYPPIMEIPKNIVKEKKSSTRTCKFRKVENFNSYTTNSNKPNNIFNSIPNERAKSIKTRANSRESTGAVRPFSFENMQSNNNKKSTSNLQNKITVISLLNQKKNHKNSKIKYNDVYSNYNSEVGSYFSTRNANINVNNLGTNLDPNNNTNNFKKFSFISNDNGEKKKFSSICTTRCSKHIQKIQFDLNSDMNLNITKVMNNSSLKSPSNKYKSNNPQVPVEYFDDIYTYLKGIEYKNLPTFDYMTKIQEDITERMRIILLDWLIEVHLKYKLLPETLHVTVGIIDRFLSKQSINRRELQLLGVSAMLIACKYEEIYPPEAKDFAYLTDDAYTKSQILKMEYEILSQLDFVVTFPSSLRFLELYAFKLGLDKLNMLRCQYLIENSLISYSSTGYKPSEVAATALYVNLMKNSDSCGYNEKDLHEVTQYTKEELVECIEKLRKELDRTSEANCKYKALRRKYEKDRFEAVAKQNFFE